VRRLALVLAAGLTLAACGEEPRPANEPRVRLKLDVPSDGRSVRAERVTVRGSVTPADAAVRVAGEDADVTGGAFVAEVVLVPGGNIIDVSATAPGRRPATDAVRVLRDMRVEVPRLVGQELEAAEDSLGRRELRAVESRSGNWLDRLLGGTVRVCASRPAGGSLVEPRSTIVLETSAGDC
jgi:hypothetical protein